MKLSVVIPVHNGGVDFQRCLEALINSKRQPDEIMVVDDVSTDASATLARSFEAQVLCLEGNPHGPAAARNRGARLAQGDILVFIDADVAVHEDTLAIIEETLVTHPEISALFGSYDDSPPKNGVVSRYKNLQHHYVHQHSAREASSFWAGCGAIRRDIFLLMGGFNEGYSRPSIEDIELGLRLKQGGYRVWLCADIQVAHLKQWTISTLLRSDIFARAIPWTRLIISSSHLPADLNLDSKSRLSVLVVWACLFFLVLGVGFPIAWVGLLVGAVALATLNLGLYRLFFRKAGLGFCVRAVLLHALYYLYSSLIFAVLLFQQSIRNWVKFTASDL